MTDNQGLKCLFALDGSEQSQSAVEYAAEFLKANQLKSHLLHVTAKVPEHLWDAKTDPVSENIEDFSNWESLAREEAEKFLNRAKEVLVKAGAPESEIHPVIKPRSMGVARDILAETRQEVDAVVMGRTGISRLKNLVMGGTANKLMGKLTDTTLCVISGKPSPQKILLAVDASQGATRALEFLTRLPCDREKEITLFHAVRHFKLPPYLLQMPEMVEAERRLIKEQREAISPVMKEFSQRLAGSGFNPSLIKRITATGVASRAGAIIDEASVNEIGTIIIGRRGLSRVEQFFMGRVSNKVVQMAKNTAVWVVA